MNLSLPFIGGAGAVSDIFISASLLQDGNTLPAPVLDFAVENGITATELSIEYSNETNILVEADAPTENVIALDFSVESDVRSIDNEFNIQIEMKAGVGFPVYVGELSTTSSTVESIGLDAIVTEEATAYIAGDVHAASDVNVTVTTENEIHAHNRTVSVENVIESSDMQIKLEGTVESTDGTVVLMEADRVGGETIAVSLSAEVLAVDVLLDVVTIPEGQIVYKVADIDRGIMNGVAKIYPQEWSPLVVNIPVLEDGTRATISNFVIPKLKEKYGNDIHNFISMIISRDTVTGNEYNFIISESYTTPEGSINDFTLCSIEDESFKAVPFIIKSTSNETLTLEWEV